MSTIWQNVTWNVARAGGLTAYLLLTLAVCAGLALSAQLQSPARWPRLVNNELHNFLTLLATIFVGLHVLAVWVDPFTHFGWNEVLIPLASHYRPIWVALGICALYLGIAIGISTLLRPHIGYRWWRRLHLLTLLLFALATLHGLGSGSDSQSWWALALYGGSLWAVGWLLWRRVQVARRARQERAQLQKRLQVRQAPRQPAQTMAPPQLQRPGAWGTGTAMAVRPPAQGGTATPRAEPWRASQPSQPLGRY
ncbi:MAG: ferric reductase-like transmembrane domain-containing protein [Thermogemmatispora sp.]|uniref:ferric reductase-like transmembrane domain-containing protein n=1 Tax=Thermogemmatispora sp. TaxID=1968838 RepID=UPI0019F43266|nr:ferric reductase-like transmembrane domain-containing protein [Thermogemmatispora sp.]MBE3568447.1 ferric reductase-like transmembrane domain-containing protein [Thermogemmatispora sp.]